MACVLRYSFFTMKKTSNVKLKGLAVSVTVLLCVYAGAETGENITLNINNPEPVKAVKENKAVQDKAVATQQATSGKPVAPVVPAVNKDAPPAVVQEKPTVPPVVPAVKPVVVQEKAPPPSATPEKTVVTTPANEPAKKIEVPPKKLDAASSVESKSVQEPEKKIKKFGPGLTKPKGDDKITSMGVSPVKFIVALLVVGGLMGAVLYVVKKAGRRYTGAGTSGLTIKSRLQVDNKNSVVLVRVYEQEILLGVGTNGINLISKLSPIDDLDGDQEDPAVANNVNVVKTDSEKGNFVKKLQTVNIDSIELKSVKDEL